MGCHAASNALLISRNAQQVVSFFLKLHSMRLTSVDPADSVDLPTRKPCWLSLNQVLGDTASAFRRVWRMRSKTLDREQMMLIGR